MSDIKISDGLNDVRSLVADCLRQTTLQFLIEDLEGLVGTGKMLRSRLALLVGPANNIPHKTLVYAAAAVEMVHAASLLHDDVIDGGYLRRNAPTFWVERGIPGAILVGDLMLFKSLDMLNKVQDGQLTPKLIRLTGEVCDAESEQELLLRGTDATWNNCVSIARRKTGALFAFAAAACGGNDEALSNALEKAGYAVGTAYQLADDILDATGADEESGKSLGSDETREKTTAVTTMVNSDVSPVSYIEELCQQAEGHLLPWPDVHKAWQHYMNEVMWPALGQNMARFSS